MKLLVDGRQLFLSQDLAIRIGVEEALFLQQLYYRLETRGVEKEGHIWYRQTYQGWGGLSNAHNGILGKLKDS